MPEYQRTAQPSDAGPPQTVDVLADIFKQAKPCDHYPGRPYDAAHWWIEHQQPPNEFTERVEKVVNGDKVTWRTPYTDRVAGTLRKFLGLSSPQQAYVVAQIEAGIPWRGDDIQSFTGIVAESQKMKQNREGYISKASSILSNFQGGRK